MRFLGVSDKNFMDHMMERYGKIWASDLEAFRQVLGAHREVDRLIGVYLQRVEDAIQFAQDRKTPFTPAQIVQTAYHAVNKVSRRQWRKRHGPG